MMVDHHLLSFQPILSQNGFYPRYVATPWYLKNSLEQFITSWWLNQPHWKILYSQNGNLPQVGVEILPQFSGWKWKKYLKPPSRLGPSCRCLSRKQRPRHPLLSRRPLPRHPLPKKLRQRIVLPWQVYPAPRFWETQTAAGCLKPQFLRLGLEVPKQGKCLKGGWLILTGWWASNWWTFSCRYIGPRSSKAHKWWWWWWWWWRWRQWSFNKHRQSVIVFIIYSYIYMSIYWYILYSLC